MFPKIACLVGSLAVYECFTYCFSEYISCFGWCDGPSMQPTLWTGDVILTESISKRFNRFHRGDIIVCKYPIEPDQFICKRLIGLPGDRICIQPLINVLHPFASTKSVVTDCEETANKTNVVKMLDGTADHEKSAPINTAEMTMGIFLRKEIYVPKGMLWLEGDNTDQSEDSRMFGPVPMGLVESRVFCRIWPLNKIKLFNKCIHTSVI